MSSSTILPVAIVVFTTINHNNFWSVLEREFSKRVFCFELCRNFLFQTLVQGIRLSSRISYCSCLKPLITSRECSRLFGMDIWKKIDQFEFLFDTVPTSRFAGYHSSFYLVGSERGSKRRYHHFNEAEDTFIPVSGDLDNLEKIQEHKHSENFLA